MVRTKKRVPAVISKILKALDDKPPLEAASVLQAAAAEEDSVENQVLLLQARIKLLQDTQKPKRSSRKRKPKPKPVVEEIIEVEPEPEQDNSGTVTAVDLDNLGALFGAVERSANVTEETPPPAPTKPTGAGAVDFGELNALMSDDDDDKDGDATELPDLSAVNDLADTNDLTDTEEDKDQSDDGSDLSALMAAMSGDGTASEMQDTVALEANAGPDVTNDNARSAPASAAIEMPDMSALNDLGNADEDESDDDLSALMAAMSDTPEEPEADETATIADDSDDDLTALMGALQQDSAPETNDDTVAELDPPAPTIPPVPDDPTSGAAEMPDMSALNDLNHEDQDESGDDLSALMAAMSDTPEEPEADETATIADDSDDDLTALMGALQQDSVPETNDDTVAELDLPAPTIPPVPDDPASGAAEMPDMSALIDEDQDESDDDLTALMAAMSDAPEEPNTEETASDDTADDLETLMAAMQDTGEQGPHHAGSNAKAAADVPDDRGEELTVADLAEDIGAPPEPQSLDAPNNPNVEFELETAGVEAAPTVEQASDVDVKEDGVSTDLEVTLNHIEASDTEIPADQTAHLDDNDGYAEQPDAIDDDADDLTALFAALSGGAVDPDLAADDAPELEPSPTATTEADAMAAIHNSEPLGSDDADHPDDQSLSTQEQTTVDLQAAEDHAPAPQQAPTSSNDDDLEAFSDMLSQPHPPTENAAQNAPDDIADDNGQQEIIAGGADGLTDLRDALPNEDAPEDISGLEDSTKTPYRSESDTAQHETAFEPDTDEPDYSEFEALMGGLPEASSMAPIRSEPELDPAAEQFDSPSAVGSPEAGAEAAAPHDPVPAAPLQTETEEPEQPASEDIAPDYSEFEALMGATNADKVSSAENKMKPQLPESNIQGSPRAELPDDLAPMTTTTEAAPLTPSTSDPVDNPEAIDDPVSQAEPAPLAEPTKKATLDDLYQFFPK
ncbi:hypothetical protein TG4357_03647 [Thalassovita gelatinovora]|uniref:Uncharacterized protein n=1 Tax=Thalassovita gelatinovora TaxID=53501 RepID=A0A0P1G436_THAGE|nr:hypothetical protein [Thalassovita gelatinovora]QIZ78991.1 hypothetical protein HFZ77_00120 [Thalassovita gelatinovora]CUH68527.1 hypothetical protein TG4357_03647 [Thalassovita gelatinovora]SEQ54056.1 hypothetical protein SAMN04488043_106108 [Thalassovita gelatinovora]